MKEEQQRMEEILKKLKEVEGAVQEAQKKLKEYYDKRNYDEMEVLAMNLEEGATKMKLIPKNIRDFVEDYCQEKILELPKASF